MENSKKLQKKILEDQSFRKQLAKNNLFWFAHIYFPHYIKHPTGNFQKQIYEVLENWDEKFVEILAFRGSAKSTIAILILPIWAVVTGRAKFPLLLADTFTQARLHIANIKSELENNKLLIKDWGLFTTGRAEWQATNLVLPRYDARIITRSTGQKVRGIRHKEFRPDLCVCDDLENPEGVSTQEGRNKTYFWFLGDIIPALADNAKTILVGNLLHSDCLLMKIKKEIENDERDGIKLEFPFLNKNGEALWKEKFPDAKSIEKEKAKINDSRTWQREFLLKIIPAEGQVVKDNWIQYYDRIPENISSQATGVDLAISKKTTADYTAMVSAKLVQQEEEKKIYIVPNPVNERLTLHETIEKARDISLALGGGILTDLFVEDVAYQKSAIQEMERVGLPAKSFKVVGDKRARLETIATYIQNGTVLFPRKGCEDLIIQLLGFGVERYDDLADGFSIVVSSLISGSFDSPRLTIISGDDDEKELEPELKAPTKFGRSQAYYRQQEQRVPSLNPRFF